MRTCRKCKIEKLERDFYHKSDSPDGIDCRCKDCRIKDSKERQGTAKKLPWSTEQAIWMMCKNGIPATVGYVVGNPGKDIVAYGYITVEAKSAQPHGINGYIFGLTKSQKERHCAYYVLICKDTGRTFVVPGDNPVLTLGGSALYINVNDTRLAIYENAWQQIKDRVLSDIDRSEPIQSVMTFSGGKYREISR